MLLHKELSKDGFMSLTQDDIKYLQDFLTNFILQPLRASIDELKETVECVPKLETRVKAIEDKPKNTVVIIGIAISVISLLAVIIFGVLGFVLKKP